MTSARMFLKAGLLAMALMVGGASVPAGAQQVFRPTADAVKEDQLLNALKEGDRISGRISIPDEKAANLIQPAGQAWRSFHQDKLPTIGAVVILGMLGALVLFFLVRGRIRVEKGFSGQTITRFATFDRFTHWLTAGCFIILAFSGLNISFGRMLILPIFGPETFATLTAYGKLAHNYLAFPFMLGVAMMFLIWVRDNIPNGTDLNWVLQGGGIFAKGKHPKAGRFNAGQKAIFWIVAFGGAAMSFSGWFLLFPYMAQNGVSDLQFYTTIHAVFAVVFIAVMLAHIYIGTLGMEGAFDAMGTGEVDVNWAREHHALWIEEEEKKRAAAPARAVPAE